MPRRMRVRETVLGRAVAYRNITFLLRDDATLAVLAGDKVIEEFESFARALRSFGLRRTDLELVAVDANEWIGLPFRG